MFDLLVKLLWEANIISVHEICAILTQWLDLLAVKAQLDRVKMATETFKLVLIVSQV